jgi:hypothetical protein
MVQVPTGTDPLGPMLCRRMHLRLPMAGATLWSAAAEPCPQAADPLRGLIHSKSRRNPAS